MGNPVGKVVIAVGIVIILIGVVLYFWSDKLHWIGRLPGDVHIERENFRFYFPVTTLIILNVVIFLIIRLWKWLNL